MSHRHHPRCKSATLGLIRRPPGADAGFTNYAYRMSRQFAALGLLARKWSVPGALSRSTPAAARCRSDFGESRRSRGRLAVQIGTTTRRRWPRWAAAVEEYRVSVVDINFGCPVRDCLKKPKAARTCSAIRSRGRDCCLDGGGLFAGAGNGQDSPRRPTRDTINATTWPRPSKRPAGRP